MKVEIVATTSDRIKEAMQKKNIKQADLARMTGIDKSSISLYISGKYSPKGDKLYKLSLALGVSAAWLSGFNAPMTDEEKNPPVSRRGTPGEEMQPISENTQKLVDFVKTVPEDKAEYLLRVMKSILE